MKLGFLTACMPRRSLAEVCAWAQSNGFEALEVAAWPAVTVGSSSLYTETLLRFAPLSPTSAT